MAEKAPSTPAAAAPAALDLPMRLLFLIFLLAPSAVEAEKLVDLPALASPHAGVDAEAKFFC